MGPKLGVFGEPRPQYESRCNETKKGPTLGENTSFELSTMKIGSAVWAVPLLKNQKESEKKTENHMHFGPPQLRPLSTDLNQILHIKS